MNIYQEICAHEGMFLLPEGADENVFMAIGFEIFKSNREGWHGITLPKNWKMVSDGKYRTVFLDSEGSERGEIFVTSENHLLEGGVLSARLFNRYKVDSEMGCHKKRVFIFDRKTKAKIYFCLGCTYDDDHEFANNSCVKRICDALTQILPGWDNPLNWDDNPLIIGIVSC